MRPSSSAVHTVFAVLGAGAIALFLALFVLTQLSGMSVAHGAVSAGAMPALLAAYFWLYRRELRAYALGIAAVVAGIAIHYAVVAIMAHSGTAAALAAASVEVAVCVVVIAMAHRHLARQALP